MPTATPAYHAPTEVAAGIYLLPVPIPIPLKYTNCYLCRGVSGWTVVDTGFHNSLAQDVWLRALADLSVRVQEITQILVTHYHPDHIGAAGWLQELTGAPAYVHEPELAEVDRFWGQGMEQTAESMRDQCRAEGMDAEMAEAIRRHHREQQLLVQPLPTLTPVPTGSRFQAGRGSYEVIWTPGHSDGGALFWDQASGILLAGDMILNTITPNVSLWPGGRPDPLADYLESLRLMEGLGAKLALPGHRTVVTDVAGRAAEIRRHHGQRLASMAGACDGPQGATAWEVCCQVFPTGSLTIHQVRFAMAETLAHLVYLVHQGRLARQGNRFVPVP